MPPPPPSSCCSGFGRSFSKFGQSSENSIKSSTTNKSVIPTNPQPKNSETCLVLNLGTMRYNVMEITLSNELSKLIVSQQELKNTNKKQIVLSIIFVMTVAFSTKLSFGLLFATLCIVAATLVYITISMQDSITALQRNLFTIFTNSYTPRAVRKGSSLLVNRLHA